MGGRCGGCRGRRGEGVGDALMILRVPGLFSSFFYLVQMRMRAGWSCQSWYGGIKIGQRA